MKSKTFAFAVALIAIVWFAWTGVMRGHGDKAASTTETSDTGAEARASDPHLAALQDNPQVLSYRQRQDFETNSKRFFRDAATLGPVEREKQARALATSIDKYEREAGLSAGEALLLRSALIKATVADETRQATQLAELMQDYRARADRGTAEYLAQHQRDPRFQDYKARERGIVAEVTAMHEIPNGLSRDEYLRQRLQQARELAYRK